MSENGGGSQSPEGRPIPVWGWIVGILLFPGGMFVALAAARAIRWWAAMLFAIGSFGIYYMLATIAESEPDFLCGPAAVLAITWFCVAAGQFQYSIGRRHNLWTREATRIWKVIGWITVVLAAVFSATQYVYLCVREAYGS